MIERNQRKRAKGPEDEGMRQARQRAFADDLCLKHHLPDKVGDALADGRDVKAGVFLRLQDFIKNYAEAPPETVARGHCQPCEEQLL